MMEHIRSAKGGKDTLNPWKGKALFVDDLVVKRVGREDTGALRTMGALERSGANIYVFQKPKTGPFELSDIIQSGSNGRKVALQFVGMTDSEEILDRGLLAEKCAVVGRISSNRMPAPVSTGAVTVITSSGVDFGRVVAYLNMFLHFGEGDFARGYDIIKDHLRHSNRRVKRAVCDGGENARALYLS
jgi:hypothetical protein